MVLHKNLSGRRVRILSILPSTFRNRLSFALGLVLVIFSSIVGLTFYYAGKISDLNALRSSTSELIIDVQTLFIEDGKFNINSRANYYFYSTGNNAYLSRRVDRINEINKILTEIGSEQHEITNSKLLNQLGGHLDKYDQGFNKTTDKRLERGFKDYGKEGQMREYVHKLLEQNQVLKDEEILMLRRHEKDFFLRFETEYIDKLNTLVDELIRELTLSDLPSAMTELDLLSNYRVLFNDIANLDLEIGKDEQSGLRSELSQEQTMIMEQSNVFRSRVVAAIDKEERAYLVNIIATLFAGFLTLIVMVLFIVQSTSLPVEELAQRLRSPRSEKKPYRIPYRSMPVEIREVLRLSKDSRVMKN